MNQKALLVAVIVAVLVFFYRQPPGPTPGPGPGPAPIPVPGLKVLILEESNLRNQVPKGQQEVLKTTLVEAYVKSKGGEYHLYDASQVIADPVWEAARNRPRTGLPWLIVSNGTKGVEEVLPDGIEATLTAIKGVE